MQPVYFIAGGYRLRRFVRESNGATRWNDRPAVNTHRPAVVAGSPVHPQLDCKPRFTMQLLIRLCLLTTLALTLLSGSVVCADKVNSERKRPNVILIMVDDLGYGDLSCYGSRKIRTPVLDTMASEGVRLTDFYAGCTVCTPSRMALLTGSYPVRVGWRGGVVGYGIKPTNGLAPEALTMAEVFQSAGYATALIGKWHLGDDPTMLPMQQGFESTYYITQSNNQTQKLYRGDKLLQNPFDNRLLTEQFTTEAIRFIRAKQRQPFFLYLPLTAPHFPAQAHPEWRGKSSLGAYGDVVEELDHRLGQIFQTLRDSQLDQQTLVVFLSDNGPEPGQRRWAQSKPYRGLKWSSLEGGNRVPCIARWPGVIPPGRVVADLTAAIDWLPTLTRAAGIDLATSSQNRPKIDGVDVWQTLLGTPQQPHPRQHLLFWDGWGTPQAIRSGEWKLYLDRIPEIKGSDAGPVLIHLPQDPEEKNNQSAQHPQRVQTLKQLAQKQLDEIQANGMPLGGPPSRPAKPRQAAWLTP